MSHMDHVSYIEIVILRHLRSRPAHGYELRKRVEETTGFVLHNNSLYPALKRFEEAGAVTRTAVPQEGRPPRLVYTITDTGRELLHDMIADFPADQAADDTEFAARLGQFSLISPAERAVVLATRTNALHERLAHLRKMHDRASARRALGCDGQRGAGPPVRARAGLAGRVGRAGRQGRVMTALQPPSTTTRVPHPRPGTGAASGGPGHRRDQRRGRGGLPGAAVTATRAHGAARRRERRAR